MYSVLCCTDDAVQSQGEGQGLALVMAELPMVTERRPAPCRECPAGRCMWRVAATRSYLYAAQSARMFKIPLDEAIRDNLKSSREDAGLVHRRRSDPLGSLDIAIVLETIRDRYGLALQPHNAERIAAIACPDRCREEDPR